MFVPDLLDRGIDIAPERDCVVLGSRRLSFAEVDDRAARLASALDSAGVSPGDHVLLVAQNEAEFLEIQIACQRVGAALVALNFRLAPSEMAAIVADCTPVLAISGAEYVDVVGSFGIPTVWHLGGEGARAYDTVIAAAAPRARGPLRAEAIAQIAYTSGTTGKPKGARISNGTLFGRIAILTSNIEIDDDDVFLQTLPLFHLASLVSFAFTVAAVPMVIVREFDPAGVLRLIADERVTKMITVPTIIGALLAAAPSFDGDLTSMRVIYYGASPISAKLVHAALETFGCRLAQFYGMTEAGIAILLQPEDHGPNARPELASATGRQLRLCRVEILRADGTVAAPGEVGEVAISGPGVMEDYLGNPEATAAAIVGGRMMTGDAGYFTADGYLYMTDRIKDMVISGGENVFGREVEDALLAHPAVDEVAVIGLPHPEWGQSVHAIVVSRAGVADDELDAWCRERIAAYKRPRSYERVDALPRNAVGKVLKYVLRAERND